MKNFGIDEIAVKIDKLEIFLEAFDSNHALILDGDIYFKNLDRCFKLFYAN